MKKIFLGSLLLLSHAIAISQAGSLDSSFGNQGVVRTHIGSQGYTDFTCAALQSDGKIVAAGFTTANGKYNFGVARYRSNGMLDPDFSEDGVVVIEFESQSLPYALALQPDGKIIVAGYVEDGIRRDFALARLNADGTLDNSFSGDGRLVEHLSNGYDEISSVSVQADGKVVAVGYSDISNDLDFEFEFDFVVARYNVDGTPDNSFSGDGKVFTDFGSGYDIAAEVLLLPNGKIMVVGSCNPYETADIAIARYNADGSLDISFDGDGKVTRDINGQHDNTTSAVLQPDGKIVVSATTLIQGHGTDFAVVRFNSDGSFDNTFSGDGKLIFDFGSTNEAPTSLAIQPDGKIIVGGFGTGVPTQSEDFRLARLNPDGTFDNSFSGDGRLVMSFDPLSDILEALVLTDNHVIAVGRTNYFGTAGILAAFQINAPGSTTITCPGNKTTTSDPGLCSTVINNIDPILSVSGSQVNYELTGATVWNGTGSVSGFRFPSGLTTVTYRLTNEPTKSCSFTLDIRDNEFPQSGYSPIQKFCFNSSNNYTLETLHATDNCGLRSIEYEISGATVRSGGGNNASGFLSPGRNLIKWTIKDISFNTTTIFGEIQIDQPLTVTIPDAYVLPYGVAPNTVYRGYSSGAPILLQAIPSGGDGIYATMWSNGFPATWTMVGPGISTTYTVTVTDLSGCTATASKRINVIDVRCGELRNKVTICVATPTGSMLLCVDDWLVGNYLANGAYLLGICPPQLNTSIPRSADAKEQVRNKLNVSPNPSQHEFRIRLDSENMEMPDLIVRDQMGRVVERMRITPNRNILIGRSYQPGVYFVEIVHGREKYTAKLIKQ
jgi:uncharacterized delta-60 repeat protein